MAFPEGKFFQNGVDLINLCESDDCGNLEELLYLKNNNNTFKIPGATEKASLNTITSFNQEGTPVTFPLIGHLTLPLSSTLKCRVTNSRTMPSGGGWYVGANKVKIVRNNDAKRFEISVKYDRQTYPYYYTADQFYRGVLPSVIAVELQGAGGGGSACYTNYHGGAGGGGGGYACVIVNMLDDSIKNYTFEIELGKGGGATTVDQQKGSFGTDSQITVGNGTIVIQGARGGIVTAEGGTGGAGGTVSSSFLTSRPQGILYYQLVAGKDGGAPGKPGSTSPKITLGGTFDSTRTWTTTRHDGGAGFSNDGGGGGASVFGMGGGGGDAPEVDGDAPALYSGAGGGGAGRRASATTEAIPKGAAGGSASVIIHLGYPA